MAITEYFATHNSSSGATSNTMTMSTTTNGDTCIFGSNGSTASITSWSSSPDIGNGSSSFPNIANDSVGLGSMYGVASASAQTTPTVRVTYAASQISAVILGQYNGVLGGFGNTGTNHGTGTALTVVVNKTNANNWVAGTGETTATGAQTFTAGPNTTQRNAGSGSSSTPVGVVCDDAGVQGVGNDTLQEDDTHSKTWSMCGVELKASAVTAVAEFNQRTMVGVGF